MSPVSRSWRAVRWRECECVVLVYSGCVRPCVVRTGALRRLTTGLAIVRSEHAYNHRTSPARTAGKYLTHVQSSKCVLELADDNLHLARVRTTIPTTTAVWQRTSRRSSRPCSCSSSTSASPASARSRSTPLRHRHRCPDPLRPRAQRKHQDKDKGKGRCRTSR